MPHCREAACGAHGICYTFKVAKHMLSAMKKFFSLPAKPKKQAGAFIANRLKFILSVEKQVDMCYAFPKTVYKISQYFSDLARLKIG